MGKRTGKPRGRPAGAKNRRTAERSDAIADAAKRIAEGLPSAFDGDAHAMMMLVYKDQTQPMPLRLDAAKAAIGYEKPRLAAIEHTGKDGGPLTLEIVRFANKPA